MSEFELDRPLGDDAVDRTSADALARDYRARGEVRVGAPRISPLRILAAVVGVIVLYYVLTFVQVAHTGGSHGADPADAIIVMGAAQYDGRPSPQLAARLDHVVTLWEEGVAPKVVVTGGNQPGDRFTEAQASASYLIDHGVPAEAIVQVGEGGTTYESLAAAAPVLSGLGIERVALVTDPYHALRSRLIAESEGLSVDVAAAPDGVVRGGAALRRMLAEAAGVGLGRLIGWERLSDLTG